MMDPTTYVMPIEDRIRVLKGIIDNGGLKCKYAVQTQRTVFLYCPIFKKVCMKDEPGQQRIYQCTTRAVIHSLACDELNKYSIESLLEILI